MSIPSAKISLKVLPPLFHLEGRAKIWYDSFIGYRTPASGLKAVFPLFFQGRSKPMQIHESGENYLEAILMLKMEKGAVRSIDVVQHLGFSKPRVS